MLRDFTISKNRQDSTTGNSLKTLGEANCFGPTRFEKKEFKTSSTAVMSGSAIFSENVGFPKC